MLQVPSVNVLQARLALSSRGLIGIVTYGKVFASFASMVLTRFFLSVRYDELHPSEQADRQVARAIVDAIQFGSRRWTTWFS